MEIQATADNAGDDKRIAIVGMAFRLPGEVTSLSQLWELLIEQQDMIADWGSERWDPSKYFHPRKSEKGKSYTQACGLLSDVDQFDAKFFGITPREARQLDPRQRMLLELTWHALESSNHKPAALRGSNCGVYVGVSGNEYSSVFYSDTALIDPYTMTGNVCSIAANRISYCFDFRGPSMAIDTACSSAVVAIHQACTAIRTGEVDAAIAGSAAMNLHPLAYIGFSKAKMLSPNGRCKTFDDTADGYVRSEGAVVLYLKSLQQAQKDGDYIHAVIVNTGINSDGKTTSLPVPSSAAQQSLLSKTMQEANITADQVDYLEAHGTGTPVGDAAEVEALKQTYASVKDVESPLWVGSIKSNLGHLEVTSGMAGLLKLIAMIQHRAIAPSMPVTTLNQNIDFGDGRIAVAQEVIDLSEKQQPLVFGLNCFGFGGTNTHLLLTEPPKVSHQTNQQAPMPPLVISAKTEMALQSLCDQYAEVIREDSQHYYDIAYNAYYCREALECTRIIYADQLDTLISTLENSDVNEHQIEMKRLGERLPTCFVFSGNGCQWQGMGRQLLTSSEVFRQTIQTIDTLYKTHTDDSIEAMLMEASTALYDNTAFAQPALFAIQVGVVEHLKTLGLTPSTVVGHSVGEVAAAYVTGAISLAQAVKLIYVRSHHQHMVSGQGGMVAVSLSREDGQALLATLSLDDCVDIAGVNAPSEITLSGADGAIDAVVAYCDDNGIRAHRLPLAYPFHSSALADLKTAFLTELGEVTTNVTEINFYSTVVGAKVDGSTLDADYWWRNVLDTVDFNAAVSALVEDDAKVFIEIGAHPVLASYVRDIARRSRKACAVIETLRRGNDADETTLAATVYKTWAAGGAVLESLYFPHKAAFYDLPKYPWQRESFWITTNKHAYDSAGQRREHPLLGWRYASDLLVWENHIDTAVLPYLADHQVQIGTVLPATAIFEIAYAALHLMDEKASYELANVEILAPFIFEADLSYALCTEVCPITRRITIKSRRRISDEPWLVNARADFLQATDQALSLPDIFSQGINWQTSYSADIHYSCAKHMGLAYGEAFQGISAVKVSEPFVYAEVKVPEAIQTSVAEYHMHPALLDLALQSLICLFKNYLERFKGKGFLPVALGRLRLIKPLHHLTGIYGQITKRTTRQLVANFYLLDSKQRLLGILSDCRFTQVSVADSHIHHFDYVYHAIRHRQIHDKPLIGIDTLSTIVADVNQQVGLNTVYYQSIGPLIDSLVARFIVDALKPILISGNHSFNTLCTRAKVIEAQQPFFQRCLNILEEDGYVVLDKDQRYIWQSKDSELPAAELIWLSLLGDYPNYISELVVLGRVGRNLLALCQGEFDAKTLFATHERSGTYQHLLSDAPTVEYKYRLIRAATLSLIKTYQQSQQVRFLWCGLDHGLILQKLAADFSALTLNVAITVIVDSEEQVSLLENTIDKRLVTLSTQTLEQMSFSYTDQGGYYDIIVFSDGLHQLERPRAAIESAKRLLAADGVLMTSFVMPERRFDFIEGIEPAWWPHCQNGKAISRLRHGEYWKKMLRDSGLIFDTLLTDAEEDIVEGHRVLLCQSIDQKPTVPYGLEQGTQHFPMASDASSQQSSSEFETVLIYRGVLPATLKGSSHLTAIAYSGIEEVGELLQLMAEQVAESEALRLVIMPDANEQDDQIYYQWVQLLQPLLSQTLAADNLTKQIACWLVTNQAKPSQVDCSPTVSGNPYHQMLWGFWRVAMNEYQHIHFKCIDLQCEALTATAAWFAFEACCDDTEQELIYVEDARHILRVHHQAISSLSPSTRSHVYLSFDEPGPLKNLEWYPQEVPELAADEVLIATKAAGLNFRDVMYAMRLITDEAVENGFLGPTLGMELAGDVLAVGAQVKHVQVGDRIMGFAPNSLSSLTKTKGNAVVRLPDAWSYHQAATVPTAFFTAYYAIEHLARAQADEYLLIHGAAGAVGIAAIQIAHLLELNIIATAGTDEKRDFLRMLGVQHVFDSRSYDFADQVMTVTAGEGVDIILNSLSGEAIDRNLSILKPFGRFLELGKRDFYENSKIGIKPFKDNLSYFGIDADQLLVQRPTLARQLFERVIALFKEAVLRPLPYRVFDAERVADAFRYMQQSKQIGKIIIDFSQIPCSGVKSTPAQESYRLKQDAFYVVTGGLSGFGLKTAYWCAQQGARHLCLISRSGRVAEADESVLNQLKAMKVEVVTAAVDVTDYSSLAECLDALSKTIDGVFHCATVYDDVPLNEMTETQWARVVEPKIKGAQHLDTYTREHPVNLFVMYSSATTLFGNPGQANYVAANSFVEGLVAGRRSQGLAAHFVAWGAVGDVGYLARNAGVRQMMERHLGQTLTSSEALLAHLPQVLASSRAGHTLLDRSFANTLSVLPNGKSPSYKLIYPQISATQHPGEALQIEQLLKEKTPREAEGMIAEMLADEVATILYLPRDGIPLNQPIADLGIDSLMGVELVRAVEQRFKVNIPMLSLSEGPSLRKMAKKVVAQLLKKERQDEQESDANLVAQIQRSLGQGDQSLSQETLNKVIDKIHNTPQDESVETLA